MITAYDFLVEMDEQKLEELAQKTLQSFAEKSGKSVEEVEKIAKDIEKGLEASIDKNKNPNKFFAILTSTVKKKLDID